MLSIVIVSFNARDHLRRCLQTLYAQQMGNFEVIVVDNASPDDSAGVVEREFPQARLVRNPRNDGFAVAANLGMRQAAGDVMVLLNPDSELTQDAFSAPAQYMREHPDIGALGIKVLNPDGALQLSVRRFPGLGTALFNRYSLITKLWPGNPWSRRYLMTDWDHESISDVDWASGACVLIGRGAVEKVGLLDEGYFWGFEDVDYCQRLHRAGLRVVYYPLTSVVHAIGASARTVPARALIARHKGMWRYYQAYLGSVLLLDALVYVAIWARCGVQLAMGAVRRRLRG